LLYGKVGRLRAFKYFVYIGGGPSTQVHLVWRVAHKPTCCNVVSRPEHCRHAVFQCKAASKVGLERTVGDEAATKSAWTPALSRLAIAAAKSSAVSTIAVWRASPNLSPAVRAASTVGR